MGKLQDFVYHMRVLGEAGTITYTKDTSAKLEDHGQQMYACGIQIPSILEIFIECGI